MPDASDMLRSLDTPRVDTRRAMRRALAFGSLEEVLAEIEAIERAAHEARDPARAVGEPRVWTSGNWSIGQILWHVSLAMERSLDGFGEPPLSEQFRAKGVKHAAMYPVRAKARQREMLVKDMLIERPHEPGGPSCAFDGKLEPPAQVWTADGAARLRNAIGRIRAGQPMGHTSPTMGRMVGEEWLAYHLRHAGLHLSFIHR